MKVQSLCEALKKSEYILLNQIQELQSEEKTHSEKNEQYVRPIFSKNQIRKLTVNIKDNFFCVYLSR